MLRIRNLILASLLFTVSAAFTQELSGSLEGSVIDKSGNFISNANISLISYSLQGEKGTITNSSGRFKFHYLPIGNYNIKISHVGYRTKVIENVRVQLGRSVDIGNTILEEGAITLAEISISASSTYLDPNSTNYGGNLNSADYENLPIERDYKSAVSILPQANTSYFGDQVNIAGATGFENKYFVDGVEVTDPLAGRDGTRLPYNFIKEIQVMAGGYQADTRSSLGGIINVVTNSGSNNFRTSAFGFFTSNGFSRYEKLGFKDPTQAVFKDYDVGISIGGPIIVDRLWYFIAYNPSFYTKEVDVPNFGTYTDETLIHSLAAKINWKASTNLNLSATLTGDPTKRNTVGRNINVPPAQLVNPDSYLMDLTEGGLNYSLNAFYTINQDILFHGSIDHVTRHDTGEPATIFGKNEVFFEDIQNQTWAGGPSSNWDSYRFKTNISLNGTFIIGNQTVKAGIEYKDNGVKNNYNYRGIQKFSDDFYGEYTGLGFGEVHNQIQSIYIQDTWQITNKFSIHGGLRYDSQSIIGSNDKVVQKIEIPIQPRVGLTYLPGENSTHKIYASFGRFSQEFGLFQSVNYHNDNGYDYYILYDHDPRENESGADTVYNFRHIIYPKIDGLKGQYYDEFNLGYERIIGDNFRMSIQGVYRNLLSIIDNVYFEEDDDFILGNPGVGKLSAWPKPEKEYTALTLSVERLFTKRYYFLASYTLSRNNGNYEGLFDAFSHGEFPNSNNSFNDLESARLHAVGLLPNDRTHSFKFSGYYHFTFGLNAGMLFTAQSGTPSSEYASTDSGIIFLRKRGSAGRTDFIWDLSLRFSYNIPLAYVDNLKVLLDIFHIASQRRAVDIDQQKYYSVGDDETPPTPNPTFGQAYRYQPPMSVRLGFEINI